MLQINNMFKKLSILTLILFSTASSYAVIQIRSNNQGASTYILTDASGTALPTGSLVRIGYFTNLSSNIGVINGTNYAALNSIFNPLGEGLTNSGSVSTGALSIGASAGRYAFTIDNIQGTYVNPTNAQLYIIVTNTTSLNSSPTQWAVFTNNDTTNSETVWQSPIDDPDFGGSYIARLATAAVDDTNDLPRGTYANVGGVSQIRLAPVPEPTTLASVLLGGLALLRRRRVS
jgi:hypothetical protein